MTEPVLVGRIGAPFGVRGWVRIHSFTEPPENLFNYAPWQILTAAGAAPRRPIKLLESKAHGKAWVAKFSDVNDRDAAESIKGLAIHVERELLPELNEGQFYWAELEGLDVENLSGDKLGRIDHLLDTGSADVMVIVKDDPAERHLVPFAYKQTVLQVDLAAGLMQVDWEVDRADEG